MPKNLWSVYLIRVDPELRGLRQILQIYVYKQTVYTKVPSLILIYFYRCFLYFTLHVKAFLCLPKCLSENYFCIANIPNI